MSLHSPTRRLQLNLLCFSVVMLIGTLGSSLLEGYSLIDAIYFTITTVATVGYGDMAPITPAGRGLTIFLIITGVGTFLGVIASIAELFINRRETGQRRQKLHMLIGLFFSELGNRLLRLCADSDPLDTQQRASLLLASDWQAADFRTALERSRSLHFGVAIEKIDLPGLRDLLEDRRDLLARLLESPFLLEHGSFAELLIAILHLKDELLSRDDLSALPESDRHHLAGDINRAYQQLVEHWLRYSEHLQQDYPFLYSLAVRTNPFKQGAQATVY